MQNKVVLVVFSYNLCKYIEIVFGLKMNVKLYLSSLGRLKLALHNLTQQKLLKQWVSLFFYSWEMVFIAKSGITNALRMDKLAC